MWENYEEKELPDSYTVFLSAFFLFRPSFPTRKKVRRNSLFLVVSLFPPYIPTKQRVVDGGKGKGENCTSYSFAPFISVIFSKKKAATSIFLCVGKAKVLTSFSFRAVGSITLSPLGISRTCFFFSFSNHVSHMCTLWIFCTEIWVNVNVSVSEKGKGKYGFLGGYPLLLYPLFTAICQSA